MDDQDERVHDEPTPQHYQRKIPLPPRPLNSQNNRAIIKETIPIKMANNKNRFQIGSFFDIPITLPM